MNFLGALEAAVAQTGEEMLFQVFTPTTDPGQLEQGYWAAIHVSSPASFDFELAAPRETALDLTRMLLGDDAPSEEAISDFIAEICNTVAGSLARNLADDRPLVLSPPEKGRGAPPSGPGTQAWFAGEDARLYVCVAPLGTASMQPLAG
jgi:hypothetical protein